MKFLTELAGFYEGFFLRMYLIIKLKKAGIFHCAKPTLFPGQEKGKWRKGKNPVMKQPVPRHPAHMQRGGRIFFHH